MIIYCWSFLAVLMLQVCVVLVGTSEVKTFKLTKHSNGNLRNKEMEIGGKEISAGADDGNDDVAEDSDDAAAAADDDDDDELDIYEEEDAYVNGDLRLVGDLTLVNKRSKSRKLIIHSQQDLQDFRYKNINYTNIRHNRQSSREDMNRTNSNAKLFQNNQPDTSEEGFYGTKIPFTEVPNKSLSLNNQSNNKWTSLKTANSKDNPNKYTVTKMTKGVIDKMKKSKSESYNPKNEIDKTKSPQSEHTKESQPRTDNLRNTITIASGNGSRQFKTDTSEKITKSAHVLSLLENNNFKSTVSRRAVPNKKKTASPLVEKSVTLTTTSTTKAIATTIFKKKMGPQADGGNEIKNNARQKLPPSTFSTSVQFEEVQFQDENKHKHSKTVSQGTFEPDTNRNSTEINPKLINETQNSTTNKHAEKDISQRRVEVNHSSTEIRFNDLDKNNYENIAFKVHNPKVESILRLTSFFDDKTTILNNDTSIYDNISKENIDHSENITTDRDHEYTEDNLSFGANNGTSNENTIPSPCPKCLKNGLNEDELKLLRVVAFKKELLEKLRISHKDGDLDGYQSDSPTEIPILPAPIIEETIKDNFEEMKRDESFAKDKEVIITGVGRTDCIKTNSTGCFSFDLFNKIKFDVAEAQMWFYKSKDFYDKKGQTINILDLRWDKGANLLRNFNIATEMTSSGDAWITVNVTKAVLKWMDLKMNNPMVAIQCSTCKTNDHTTVFKVKEYKPLLLIKYAKGNQVVRNKRSTTCDPSSECCHRDLHINFNDINMHEIFEPNNFSIGYCYGDCNEMNQATYNHTLLTQRFRFSEMVVNQPTMVQQLKPCCVPLILKDLFIMVIEQGTLIRKLIPKVIVESCGCV